MQRTCAIFGTIVLLASASAGATEVFRCAQAGGTVAYQELPCAEGAVETSLQVPAFPPVNTVERDRLMQRDAALDARQLKRAEIDAAERIARDARSQREAELEAERARIVDAAPYYYTPVYARPYRSYPPRSSVLPRPQPLLGN
jgi:hypothetical protein